MAVDTIFNTYRLPTDVPDIYKKIWRVGLPQIASRKNFTAIHVEQLKLLCGLFADVEKLNNTLATEGMTYESVTDKGGRQIKPHPAIVVRDKTLVSIKEYTRMLHLNLEKIDIIKDDGKKEWA